MALAAFLLILAAAQVHLGVTFGGIWWAFLWPAASALWLSLAYFTKRPRMVGKQTDGAVAWWAWILMLPYLVFAELVWRGQKALAREDAWNEVAPGLFLGRRIFAHELPADVTAVVDLTAEFAEPAALRRLPGYRNLPTLDATAPDAGQMLALVDRLASTPRLFVHCASGHGRSATVAAALLLRRGLAASVDEAIEMLRQKRPSVAPKGVQRRLLNELSERLKAGH